MSGILLDPGSDLYFLFNNTFATSDQARAHYNLLPWFAITV